MRFSRRFAHPRRTRHGGLFFAALALSASAFAQDPARDATHRPTHAREHRTGSAVPTPAPAAIRTEPAVQVVMDHGNIMVQADHAELSQVLQKLTAVCPMQVEGTPPADSVSGVYGPGTPQDVLAQLLTGYNYAMLGGERGGAPRTLLLSSRMAAADNQGGAAMAAVNSQAGSVPGAGAGNLASQSQSGAAASNSDEAANDPANDAGSAPAGDAAASGLGPGAIEHVPPNEATTSDDPDAAAARVQTNMQRLQAMQGQSTPQ